MVEYVSLYLIGAGFGLCYFESFKYFLNLLLTSGSNQISKFLFRMVRLSLIVGSILVAIHTSGVFALLFVAGIYSSFLFVVLKDEKYFLRREGT